MAEHDPVSLTELIGERPISELAPIYGRYLLLRELDLGFTRSKELQIARNEMSGYEVVAAIRKTWSGIHGSPEGLSIADIENAVQMLGIYDEVLDYDY